MQLSLTPRVPSRVAIDHVAAWFAITVAAVLAAYAPMLATDAGVPSDGQFAQFFESVTGFSDLYIGGWPAYADANSMAFYPLRFLFPPTLQGFDLFSLGALVVFACGNGALAWRLGRSRIAVLLSALAAPCLGFFAAHLGHTSMVHAGAWVPWIFLACFALSDAAPGWSRWTALLAFATALSLFAGHPQLTIFGLVGALLFVAPARMDLRAWLRAYLRAGLGVALGAGIAFVFLWPAAAFSDVSVRAKMTPELLAGFHLRPFELAVDLFPYAAGGHWSGGNYASYVGDSATSSWVENVSYIGLCLPMLIIAGLPALRRDRTAWRLAGGTVVTFALAMAPGLPDVAARLVDVPVLSMFRAWSRWQFVASIFVLQLAGLAIARLASPLHARSAGPRWWSFAPLALVPAAMLWFALTGPAGGTFKITAGTPWLQAVLGAALCLALWRLRRPPTPSRFMRALPVLLVALELAALGRQAPWANAYTRTPDDRALLAQIKGLLAADGGRLLTLSGWTSPHLGPDATRAARIPSLNWYGPLLDARFAQIAGMTQGGWTRPQGLSNSNQVFDIYGVSLIEPYVPGYLPTDYPTENLYPAPRWQPVPGGAAGHLLRNARMLPRVRVVAQAVLAGDDAAWAALTTSRLPDGSSFSARTTALVEDAKLALPAGDVPAYTAQPVPRPGARVRFAEPTPSANLVVIGDNWSPAFRAKVDGVDVATARINYNQLGVPVPKGSREVVVTYRDDRLRVGGAISAACLFVVGLLVASSFRRPRHGVARHAD